MAEGVERSRWNHTSHLLAVIANTARDSKKKPKPWQPSDFNPYARKDVAIRGEIDDLRDTFVDKPVTPGNSKRKAHRKRRTFA